MKTKNHYLLLSCLLCLLTSAGSTRADNGTSLKAAWSSTDQLTSHGESAAPQGPRTLSLTAWRGERVHAKFLIWSANEMDGLTFTVDEPEDNRWTDEATTGFLRFVMTDELNKDGKGGCGHRPDKTLFDSTLVADRIEPTTPLRIEPRTPQPAWITFDVPRTATPGLYRGYVSLRQADRLLTRLPYTLRVLERTLPLPEEQTFHLDLWQNPFAVAREAGTPLWSKAHFQAMRPLMERLARAGQRGITTSITHKPWNGQTYDYFENMITEVKRADGSWMYDYTVFDRWVEFMHSCGVGPYIYCYSVIPWELTFRYYDQATNSMVDRRLEVNNPEFDAYWVNKLRAFARHLKERGWFDVTIIAMDERPRESMEAALRVIREADADYKISLAGNYHAELEAELFDLCIGYDSRYPDGVVPTRREQGKLTTFYTCCTEAFPNTFTFSQPIEAAAFGLIAAQRDLDGYLRWAYNSWVEHPAEDSRFHTWAAGDTYLVYPDNQSSVRFEKLIEGIQMFEKIRILKAESPRHARAIDRLLQPFAYERLNADTLKEAMKAVRRYMDGL